MITRRIEYLINVLLKGLNDGSTRLSLELSSLALADQIQHLKLGFVDRRFNLTHGIDIGDRVGYSDGERRLEDPVVGQSLYLIHKESSIPEANIEPCSMDETTHARPNRFLINGAFEQFSMDDSHIVIIRIESIRHGFARSIFGRPAVSAALEINLW